MQPALRHPGQVSLLSAMAVIACPRAGRPWMIALLGELTVIEGPWPRTLWLFGAVRLVTALNIGRVVAFVANPLAIAACVLAAGGVACAVLFASGGEGLLADDDAFLSLSVLSAATSGVLLLLRVLSGHRRAPGSTTPPDPKKGNMLGMTLRVGLSALVVLALAGGAIIGLTNTASAGKGGVLDDGKQHLSQTAISLDEAIASAQSAAPGPVDEVDLEYWQGKLVYNVDVGDKDVKVDAATGAVLNAGLRD